MKTLLYLFPVLLFFSCANNDAAVSCVFSPVLETFEVTNISSSSAILRGRISFNAENCNIPPGAQQGFVYSTSSLPSIEDNLIAVYETDVSVNLDNLEPNTTYYVRTFIANSLGEYYGNELLFVTSNAINYGSSAYETSFQGLDRDYIVYIPENYTPEHPSPLLFVYHGFGGNNNLTMNYTGFNEIANQNNFIVVYPQGSNFIGVPHWNVGGWTLGSTTDDIAFTEYLINTISNQYSINNDRVYATGMSNGGFMSFLLACQMSDTFAAVASVTGSMTTETYEQCTPLREVPVLQIHGTIDPIVPYAGVQAWNTPIDEVLTYWATNNECNLTPQIISLEDIDPDNNIRVDEITYDGGTNASVVKHYKVYGGGHDWFNNAEISASELVWEFFSNYDLNGLIN